MQRKGDLAPFAGYLESVLAKLSNRDLLRFDEKHVKSIILALLNIEGTYLLESEWEAEGGYVDILLTSDARFEQWIDYEWVIELKYLPEGRRGELGRVQAAAREQLKHYIDEKVQGRIPTDRRRSATVVVIGKSEVVVDVVEG